MGFIVRRTAMVFGGLAATLAWPSSSFAEDGVEAASPAASLTVASPDPNCAIVESSSGRPSPESPPAAIARASTLLALGGVTFFLSYLPAMTIANASGLAVDRQLYVPVVGPWIDLAGRPGCGPGSVPCNAEALNQGLLIADGFFQGLAVVQLLAGLSALAHESATPVAKADDRPGVRVSPVQVGGAGYGLAAIGKF
jgi:hypothetical protein